MSAEVITFHKMLVGCIQNEFKFWQFFISVYGALTQHLIERHFASLKDKTENLLQEIFESIAQNHNSFLKDFSGSSEREFLIYFRERVFATARKYLSGEESQGELEIGALNKLFQDFPLAHQEVAWLVMKAYKDEEINKILRVPLSLVQTGRSEVLKRHAQMFGRHDANLFRLKNSAILQIESQGGPNCPAINIVSDILDGRIPWRDKTNIENHLAQCRYCLDRETALKEAIFYLRGLAPLPEAVTEGLLKALKLQNHKGATKSSLLAKVMKVFK